MNLFILSTIFIGYHYVSGIILSAVDTVVNKLKAFALKEFMV